MNMATMMTRRRNDITDIAHLVGSRAATGLMHTTVLTPTMLRSKRNMKTHRRDDIDREERRRNHGQDMGMICGGNVRRKQRSHLQLRRRRERIEKVVADTAEESRGVPRARRP